MENKNLSQRNIPFVINAEKCRATVTDNHELELKRLEKRMNLPKNLKKDLGLSQLPGVSFAIEEKSPPTTSTPTNTVATKFKMDFLDMERNKDLSGIKESLLKLERFKRSFTSSDKTITSKTEDIDFDAL